jgi:hypothetical protein
LFVGSSPTSNPQGPHRPRFDEARGTRTGSGTAAVGAQAPFVDDSTAVSSGSSEMALLLDRLRAIPEVRTDRLSQVGERLEQGAYLTREAAEQTAAALLGSRRE